MRAKRVNPSPEKSTMEKAYKSQPNSNSPLVKWLNLTSKSSSSSSVSRKGGAQGTSDVGAKVEVKNSETSSSSSSAVQVKTKTSSNTTTVNTEAKKVYPAPTTSNGGEPQSKSDTLVAWLNLTSGSSSSSPPAAAGAVASTAKPKSSTVENADEPQSKSDTLVAWLNLTSKSSSSSPSAVAVMAKPKSSTVDDAYASLPKNSPLVEWLVLTSKSSPSSTNGDEKDTATNVNGQVQVKSRALGSSSGVNVNPTKATTTGAATIDGKKTNKLKSKHNHNQYNRIRETWMFIIIGLTIVIVLSIMLSPTSPMIQKQTMVVDNDDGTATIKKRTNPFVKLWENIRPRPSHYHHHYDVLDDGSI